MAMTRHRKGTGHGPRNLPRGIRRLWFVATPLLVLLTCAVAYGDMLELRNGRRVEGTIIMRGPHGIVLRSPNGKTVFYYHEETNAFYRSSLEAPPPPEEAPPPAGESPQVVADLPPSAPPPSDALETLKQRLSDEAERTFEPQAPTITPAKRLQMRIAAAVSAIGSICQTIGSIMILIAAFRNDGVTQGFLCLCCSPYFLFYALAKYESERKGIALLLFFGGFLLAVAGQIAGGAMFFEELTRQFM